MAKGKEDKGKKEKGKKHNNKLYEIYEASGDSVNRKNPSCPKCGPGFSLAVHKDRKSCGKCGYTDFGGKVKEKVEKEVEKKVDVELDDVEKETSDSELNVSMAKEDLVSPTDEDTA